MPNHVIRPAIAVMFENQWNTVPEPLLTPIYDKNAKEEQKARET